MYIRCSNYAGFISKGSQSGADLDALRTLIMRPELHFVREKAFGTVIASALPAICALCCAVL